MNFAVLDFETTGSHSHDEIIQVGLVRIEDGRITKRFQSLVKPETEIPEFITQLTGITQTDVEEAPALEEVLPKMLPLVEDAALVGHQVAFDLGFFQRALDMCGYGAYSGSVLDLMDLLKVTYPGLSSYQLQIVSSLLDVPHERPHQADSDAEATAVLWLKGMEKLESLSLLTLQRLSQLFADLPGDDFGAFIREMVIVKQEQSVPEVLNDDHFYRQFQMNVGEWRNIELPRDEDGEAELNPSFPEFVQEWEEKLQAGMDGYELRDAQKEMMHHVYDALSMENHLLVEAGTGTGKSLGYMLPSLYYGVLSGEKIVVSTHTINLQEQLRQRDIPLLQAFFPVPFSASVMKGRNHYLCLRKFEQKFHLNDFTNRRDERLSAAQMVVWLSETEHGDDEEINLGQSGRQLWQHVASDTDSCLNRACPWFKRCFYHRAKHEAQLADVVITNHSMLFTDVKAEHRLLPAYDRLIIDEAHHFQETAEKHLGTTLHYQSIFMTLQWLYKDERNGLTASLRTYLEGLSSEAAEKSLAHLETLTTEVPAAQDKWLAFTELFYQGLEHSSAELKHDNGQASFRLHADRLLTGWETIEEAGEEAISTLNRVVKLVESIQSEWQEGADEEFDLQAKLTDLNGVYKNLKRYQDELRFLLKMDEKDYVYWVEASANYRHKSLHWTAIPIDVSPLLQQYFFEAKQSVILTSATLTVGKSFDYAISQVGLAPYEKNDRLKSVQLTSSFDYRKQSLVVIPRDFPKINGPGGEAEFTEQLTKSLSDVARKTRGRLLVLFTSYKMLKQVHHLLKEELATDGVEVLGQGIESSNRSKLTRWFQQSRACVLLGTNSFWEGVDIPGEALTALAIVRLPFQPPNHPVVEAKSDRLKEEGKNPFMSYSVPQAVIRFKQGFGRLVRTSQDHGIAIIYDTRVIETRYGKKFLYSLPGPKMEHMRTEQLVPRVTEWLEEREEDKKKGERG